MHALKWGLRKPLRASIVWNLWKYLKPLKLLRFEKVGCQKLAVYVRGLVWPFRRSFLKQCFRGIYDVIIKLTLLR
jgi:hypothetical protein